MYSIRAIDSILQHPGVGRHQHGPRMRDVNAILNTPTRTASPMAGSASGPHGLDLDSESGRAFVACDAGIVSILDLTGRELGTVEIAGEPDVTWHNPERSRLYVAIGRPGVVDVVDTKMLKRTEQITTEECAHTAAFDRARQRLYVLFPGICRAAVYWEV